MIDGGAIRAWKAIKSISIGLFEDFQRENLCERLTSYHLQLPPLQEKPTHNDEIEGKHDDEYAIQQKNYFTKK